MVDLSVEDDVPGEKDEEDESVMVDLSVEDTVPREADESVVDDESESAEFSDSTTLAAAPAALMTAQD